MVLVYFDSSVLYFVFPLLSRTRSRERRKLPQQAPGPSPNRQKFGAFWICRGVNHRQFFHFIPILSNRYSYSKISTEIYCSICRLFNKQAEVSLKKLSSGHDNVSSVFEIKIVVKNFHFGSSSSQRYLLVLFVLCLFCTVLIFYFFRCHLTNTDKYILNS